MSQTCDIHWMLHGADKPSAEEARRTMDGLVADWGIAPKEVMCTRFDDPDVAAETNNAPYDGFGSGQFIRLSEYHFGDYENWKSSLRKQHDMIGDGVLGFVQDHPAGYCIMHEYGHVLQGAIYGEMQPSTPSCGILGAVGLSAVGVMPPIPPGVDVRDMPPAVAKIVTLTWTLGAFEKKDMLKVARDLSLYATANPPEMMAEAFVRDRLYPGTSKVATAVMDLVRSDFERKFHRPAPQVRSDAA